MLWSAALHALGLGFAGWATHGRDRDAVSPPAPDTTRSYALHYLTPTPPKPAPQPTAARAPARGPRPPPRLAPVPAPASGPLASTRPLERLAAPRARLHVQELAPRVVTGIREIARLRPAPPPPVSRGLDRGAAIVSGAGSACPALPLPAAGGHRDLVVSVEVVVDSNGWVDPSALRVVESPARSLSKRRYYPRIYVVGARLKKQGARVDEAGYHAMLTETVTSHVARLTFYPAMKDGRPVGSTVLIACHRSTDG